MKLGILSIAAMIGLSSAASAQGISHKGTDLTFGYDDWSVSTIFGPGSEDGSTSLARVRTDWGIGANFGTQVNLDYAEFSIDGGSGSARTLALHPYWEVGTTGRAGVFYQRSEFESGSDALEYYGAEGMFTPTPELSLEIYAGVGQFTDSSEDLVSYGATLYYAMNDTFGVHAAYDHENFDLGPTNANNSRFNIGVDYHLNTAGSMPPMIFTAEAGRVDIFGIVDMTVVGAKVTIPLGGTAGSTGRKLYRERGIMWAAGGLLSGGP